MQAGDAFRIRACGGDGSDRQGRGVGREDASLADDGLERSKQRLLGIQALDDRFDHQIDARNLGEVARRPRCARSARAASSSVSLRFAASIAKRRGDRAPRFRRSIGLDVENRDVESRLRSDLCDAASHQTGADDGYRARHFGHRVIVLAGHHAGRGHYPMNGAARRTIMRDSARRRSRPMAMAPMQ